MILGRPLYRGDGSHNGNNNRDQLGGRVAWTGRMGVRSLEFRCFGVSGLSGLELSLGF